MSPFNAWGWSHVGVLLATAGLAAGGSLLLRLTAARATSTQVSSDPEREQHLAERAVRAGVCFFFAIALITAQAAGQINAVLEHRWSAAENLPLHLCDLSLFVGMFVFGVVAFAKTRAAARMRIQTAFDVLYFWALAGGSQALLTPDLKDDFPSSAFFEFFGDHAAIIAGTLSLLFGLPIRPRPGSLMRAWLLTVGVGALMMPVNWLLGSNYMYTCGAPGRASLYDYLGPWPWSLIGLAIVGLVIMAIVYMPYWIADRIRHTDAQEPASEKA